MSNGVSCDVPAASPVSAKPGDADGTRNVDKSRPGTNAFRLAMDIAAKAVGTPPSRCCDIAQPSKSATARPKLASPAGRAATSGDCHPPGVNDTVSPRQTPAGRPDPRTDPTMWPRVVRPAGDMAGQGRGGIEIRTGCKGSISTPRPVTIVELFMTQLGFARGKSPLRRRMAPKKDRKHGPRRLPTPDPENDRVSDLARHEADQLQDG